MPELLAADPTKPVYIVEGEKDADRLASLGFVVTTTSGGSNGKWTPELSEPFAGRSVYIVAVSIRNRTCAVAFGNLSYQFTKTVTKRIIEDRFHAVRVHAFIMHQRIKLAF